MTTYKRGDVVLIEFVFPERTGKKKWPVLVINSDDYNKTW